MYDDHAFLSLPLDERAAQTVLIAAVPKCIFGNDRSSSPLSTCRRSGTCSVRRMYVLAYGKSEHGIETRYLKSSTRDSDQFALYFQAFPDIDVATSKTEACPRGVVWQCDETK